MPTYDFRCPNGHEFEHFFRTISSAEKYLKCPKCAQVAERQMSGGSGLLFKGSGFYITDYGKDGKKDQRKAAENNKSESSGSGESSKPSGDKSSSKGSGSGDA
jgi:putative FmdB family regulatory protein